MIGGVLLGPTAFGRIPGFTENIFPKPSISYLNLVATVGLVLFLFVVGLEVDPAVMKRNGRNSALISIAGMIIPFGLGAAVAVPIYHEYTDGTKQFGHFLLFICVSMSITAFPVLCRILTATKLLDTQVGVIVLAAGVGNDVVGWVLLALTLALTTAGSGVNAVYILLCAVGWSIILLWPIRKAYYWMVRRSGSLENGPTPMVMTITLLVVFASAFVTSIIGVHPIFGGFLAGLIIPHEGGFAIAITERIDDLVTMLFLPIYFVLSGLNTNLADLNNGKIWGYVILLTVVGFVGKFFGCAGVAKLCGYTWRESGAIGMLMSCKGLVELIVLNVGLEVGIINEQLFSMLVLVAIFLTVITTPGTLAIYPKRYHERLSAKPKNVSGGPDNDKARNQASRNAFLRSSGGAAGGREYTSRLLVVLQRIEHLAATMFITQLLEPVTNTMNPGTATAQIQPAPTPKVIESPGSSEAKHDLSRSTSRGDGLPPIPSIDQREAVRIDALKLIELTGRTFSVMQSAEKDSLLLSDDALQLFRQFGRLRGIDVEPHISVIGQEGYSNAVADYTEELGSELVIIPWTVPNVNNNALVITTADGAVAASSPSSPTTPFDGIFAADGSPMYTHFIRNVFSRCHADVAVFIDRGFGGVAATFTPGFGQHIFLPFFGGPDDRLALRLVIQFCHHANVTATIVRVLHSDLESDSDAETVDLKDRNISEGVKAHQAALVSNQLTVGGAKLDEQSRTVSGTADNIAWEYYVNKQGAIADDALPRINFVERSSSHPLREAVKTAENDLAASKDQPMWRPLLVVVGRGRRRAMLSHERELSEILAERGQNPTVGAELRKTVGDPATALILASGKTNQASFLVCEAGQ